eukprot:7190965-Karenia_brevis.AAC.1
MGLGAPRHSPATPAPSAQDMVNVIERLTGAVKDAMKTTADAFHGMQRTAEDDDDDQDKGRSSDKFQAISGLDFKRHLPKIEDTDPDLDRYDLAFDSAIACRLPF